MNEVAIIQARLPMPQGLNELDAGKWRVLCESVFPTAKTPAAIALALDYCKARKLDVFKKPVNIVPMWSSQLGREVETVWPGINSIQIEAARTNSWAGMDEPKWGQDITKTFKGIRKGNNGESEVTVTFPESCAVTVYRVVQGVRYAFCEPVYWLECYARAGKTELPNDMWAKRPRGQFLKVAKAFSLRAAFPEDADYTAEEMEGRIIEEVDSHNGVIIENGDKAAKSIFKNATLRNQFTANAIKSFSEARMPDELTYLKESIQDKLDEMVNSGNEHDALAFDEIKKQYGLAKRRIAEKADNDAASFGQGFGDIRDEAPTFDEEEIIPPAPPVTGVGAFLNRAKAMKA